MTRPLFATLAIFLLLFACPAFSSPTLAGPTGNGILPTAGVVPTGDLTTALDLRITAASDVDLGDLFTLQVENGAAFRASYGLADDLEAGAGYSCAKASGESANTWSLHGKYRLPLQPAGFDLSLGGIYAETDLTVAGETLRATSLYLVGTRELVLSGIPAIRGTLGINWLRLVDGNTLSGLHLFAGTSVPVSRQISLAAELSTKKSGIDAAAPYALILRYTASDALTAQLGYTNADPFSGLTGTNKGTLFAGVNTSFNMRRTE